MSSDHQMSRIMLHLLWASHGEFDLLKAWAGYSTGSAIRLEAM